MEQEFEQIFEISNQHFLEHNLELLETNVSERTLCGALMIELYETLKETSYSNYYVDVEYNRNGGNKIKTCCKTITDGNLEIIRITCDLIVHSRGTIPALDNLIAIEMKKAGTHENLKKKDKMRLMALTKDSFDDIWSMDGISLPEHVCCYQLGVYYEVHKRLREIYIEYYHHGILTKKYRLNY